MTYLNSVKSTIIKKTTHKKAQITILISFLFLTSAFAGPGSMRLQELKHRYINLPADFQARCALVKLDRILQTGRLTREKLQYYRAGRSWLTDAIDRYEEYMGSPTQLSQPLDPSASPLGLLTHLWLAKDGMVHSQDTNRLFSDNSNLSPERRDVLKKALSDAIESMRKAIAEIETSRQWNVHSDGMFLSLQVPPGFKAAQNTAYRLYLTWRPAEDSDIEKAVFVSVLPNKENLQPYEHQARAVKREREEHADLVVIEDSRGTPGVPGSRFLYGYTWSNMELHGVILNFNHKGNVWEIKYLSVANRFDEEECEGIIRSIIRK